MDKWLIIWHEDECEQSYFFLQAARDASTKDLQQLADDEILKILTDAENVIDYYVDFIINMTAECEEGKEHSFMGFSESDVAAMRPDLSEDQCYEILAIAEQRYDASLGVTWDTLEIYADQEFGPATKEA
tara:strand:- start:1174 stop:1563 length:390 start_codon:yes stop_codon:yes gene_type:complete